ncbi:hypothetical protein MKX01_039683, partial [Papaver californicum]
EIGELYEVEQNFEKSIVYFERAADLFQSEEVNTSANQCKQRLLSFLLNWNSKSPCHDKFDFVCNIPFVNAQR